MSLSIPASILKYTRTFCNGTMLTYLSRTSHRTRSSVEILRGSSEASTHLTKDRFTHPSSAMLSNTLEMIYRTHESPTYTPAFVMTGFSMFCQLRSFHIRAGFSYNGGLFCIALLLSLFIYHSSPDCFGFKSHYLCL